MTALVLTAAVLHVAPAQLATPPDGGKALSRSRGDVVLRWNETVVAAIRAEQTPPPLAARNLAIMHAAVYDSVHAVAGAHEPFRVLATAEAGTSVEAAAAVAAHRTLAALYPKQIADFDAVLDQTLAGVADGPGRDRGVILGQWVADKILTWRRGDGARQTAAYTPRSGPGSWLPTPPDYRPALLPHWQSVACFTLRSSDQFRPAAPPELRSVAYTAAFAEVKSLGERRSATRTSDQTEIARFWDDGPGSATPPGHWNEIARAVARSRGTSLGENARLFALLNLALADAATACWDGKFGYNVWRPVHAIRAADTDGNPSTRADPVWEPLLRTPPFPAYPSGHSTFSGAAATVLAFFFGRDDVDFATGCDLLPRVKRAYPGFWAAAQEAGRSRIYGGIHWDFDNSEGLKCGRLVGEHVSRHFLLPRTHTTAAVSSGR